MECPDFITHIIGHVEAIKTQKEALESGRCGTHFFFALESDKSFTNHVI